MYCTFFSLPKGSCHHLHHKTDQYPQSNSFEILVGLKEVKMRTHPNKMLQKCLNPLLKRFFFE